MRRALQFFFSIFAFVGATAVRDRARIYVLDNNLHITVPSDHYMSFGAKEFKINDVDLLPTLEKASNATKLLSAYERVLRGFYGRMDDLENRFSNVGPVNNTTIIPTFNSSVLEVKIQRLNNRVTLVQRNVRRLRMLLNKDECASNPCKNGATCLDLYNAFLCQCQTGWEGETCETDINECARYAGTDLGCQNGATCLNLQGSYQCACAAGWIGMQCNRKPTDCATAGPEICGHGFCVPQNNEIGYKCICDSGWTTDGTHLTCSVDVDECKQNHPPCSTNPLVQCVNVPGSFMCQHCPPGYTGNGYYCADINECELFNGGCSVSPQVECVNTQGSSKCGPCPPGYAGDGKNCVFKGVCNINNGGCHLLAKCFNNPAISEVQCICPPGYTGSGYGPGGCIATSSGQITGCTPNPCVHGSCSGNNSTGFHCTCNPNYYGTYCDRTNHICDSKPCMNGGTCLPRGSNFLCSCTAGYSGAICQNQQRSCDWKLTGSNGSIKYPSDDFRETRLGGSTCQWTITTDEDKVLTLKFKKFKFAKEPCTAQWLEVHNGETILAPSLGRFCGTKLPFNNGTVTTSYNKAFLWISSNNGDPEFEVEWQSRSPSCGQRLPMEGITMITSPGWPANYPNNRDCYWQFFVPYNKRVLFHIYSLNIGDKSDCSGDYLEFTTGLVVHPRELFAKLCDSNATQPFYSRSNIGFVHFKSNEKDTYRGFQIGYSVVDGLPGCGGTYTQNSGYIQSVSLTESTRFPIYCKYAINLASNSTVRFDFVEMDLEDDCNTYVSIQVKYKNDDDYSLLGKFCGSRILPPVYTYGSDLLVISKTRHDLKNRWKIKYESRCQQSFIAPSGDLIINGQTSDCIWLIEQPPGRIISLELNIVDNFNSMPFRFRPSMQNVVKIWDGDNENATLLGEYDQKAGKVSLTSSTNYLYIKVNSDTRRFRRMYVNGTYTTMDVGCGGLIRGETGTIKYPPRGEEKYASDKKCRWVISVIPGNVIHLTWIMFGLESTSNCDFDYVQVFDNSSVPGYGGLMGKFCGSTIPPMMTSTSNIVTIDFASDYTVPGAGFILTYNVIKESQACGGNYYSPAGVLKSPDYPNNYPRDIDCTWTINVPHNSQILLKFLNFSLEAYSGCRYDWLEIRNGGSSSSPLVGKYCGTTVPKTISSHTDKLYLKFHSDNSKVAPGFKIEWMTGSTGCGGTLTSPAGSITSPHYPEPYFKNTECTWKIHVNPGSKIQVYFADIDLELSSVCQIDYVQIFDGLTTNSPQLGKYCKPQTNPVMSSANTMLIRFFSDVSFQGRGFNIQYSTVCKNTLTGFGGVIESPNFPNDYPQDQDCLWEIHVDKGNKINMTFSNFALERSTTLASGQCRYDYVEIEYATETDSETPQWEKFDRYCGDKNPGLITINSNMARVHFVSDSLLMGTGFRLEWALFGCGGILTEEFDSFSTPNYPDPYPSSIECSWHIKVPFGNSIELSFYGIDVEKDSTCMYDYVQVFNGRDDTYQELAKLCHEKKTVKLTSTGNEMFVRFKADYSYQGNGFSAFYMTTPTTCGGEMSAPHGSIYSPNYPKNYNLNETCEWLITAGENHVVELNFQDVDLVRIYDCKLNYIKVYDGPTQAYPLLDTICNNTVNPNKTIRSSTDNMLVEFKSDSTFTSKGFKAFFRRSCGAKIKTSSQGMIEHSRGYELTYDSEDNSNYCNYTIESEDPTKHVTVTVTKVETGSMWCDEDTDEFAYGFWGGASNDAPLIAKYCTSKLPPPIVSDGSAIHIVLSKEVEFVATYSVLDDHCGGDLHVAEGFIASPGWPKKYPINAECTWRISMGLGNGLNFNFLEMDIPESDHCNTDYVELRVANSSGPLLGVFCGGNLPVLNKTVQDALWLSFKSTRLAKDIPEAKKGFYAEFSSVTDNVLTGPEGYVSSLLYPDPMPESSNYLYVPRTWLIHTNTSGIIELKSVYIQLHVNQGEECMDNLIKVYDGMNSDAPLLKVVCTSFSSILSTSNSMYILSETYNRRLDYSFLLEWKAMPRTYKPSANKTKECHYIYKLENQTSINLTSPGYPNGYGPNIHCEWIYEIKPQYHIEMTFGDVSFGQWNGYRVCTYSDVVRVYSKDVHETDWHELAEICNTTVVVEKKLIKGGNMMKVEFQTNRYNNGSGFQATVAGVCGGIMTDKLGIIEFGKNHSLGSQCEWQISVRSGHTIKLHFTTFDLGDASEGHCPNYILIRNGQFADSPYLGKGKFCGQTMPPDLESTSNHLFIKYMGSTSIKGFTLKYAEQSFDCGGDIILTQDDTSVEIASPNYPNIPPPHTECIWTIRAPPGEILRIDFEDRFDVHSGYGCVQEYVELRDGSSDLSPLIKTLCDVTPSTERTKNNVLRVKYFTDSEEPGDGFKANVSVNYCGGTIRESLVINSAAHNIKFGDNCTWYVKMNPLFRVILSFKTMNVAQHISNCTTRDTASKIVVFSAAEGNNVSLGAFCNGNNPDELKSPTNEMVITYVCKSNSDQFKLNIDYEPASCGGETSEDSGVLQSPNYPQFTTTTYTCHWIITVPKGRSISFVVDDMDLDPDTSYLYIREDFGGPVVANSEMIRSKATFRTSDNKAILMVWKKTSSRKRGFKISYSSDLPAACQGDLNSTSGTLVAPQNLSIFQCLYVRNELQSETLSMQVSIQTNLTNSNCFYNKAYINIEFPLGYIAKLCQNTRNSVYRSGYPETSISAVNDGQFLNYTIHYKIFKCGGTAEGGKIISPNFPHAPPESIECSWHISMDGRAHINFTSLVLGGECSKNYVAVYNGMTARDPRIAKYCKDQKPESAFISEGSNVLIEYVYEKDALGNSTENGFSLDYKEESRGCGGYIQTITTIRTPNYYSGNYGDNEECVWDIQTDSGNTVKLSFYGRFHIEESPNCTKDYVEVFDRKENKWESRGKFCGRTLPSDMVSTNNMMRVIFRSDNNSINAKGFQAEIDWECGGEYVADETEKFIASPGYHRNGYDSYYFGVPKAICVYTISSKKPSGVINVRFLDFQLNTGDTASCKKANITIEETGTFRRLKQVYCGKTLPALIRLQKRVTITFKFEQDYMAFRKNKFQISFKDASCGGNITQPSALQMPVHDVSHLQGIMRYYQTKIDCNWYVTAPLNQIPVLKIQHLNMSRLCIVDRLQVYESLSPNNNKKLASLCGEITDEQPIYSRTNTMLISAQASSESFKEFRGEVYFTYGPSAGCGGKINLTETKYLNAPNNLPHMDCHWTIFAPADYKVEMEFTLINIARNCSNPVKNHTYFCTCAFIDVRDGAGPFAEQMAKLCTSDNSLKRSFTTSWRTAYIRFYSAVSQSNAFSVTLKPVQSKCGPSDLSATNELKELTSPDYPNQYPENIKCTWIIRTTARRIRLEFDDVNFPEEMSSSDMCEGDKLTIKEDPKRLLITDGYGPSAKFESRGNLQLGQYEVCENGSKPFDYYSTGNEIMLIFKSIPSYGGKRGRGFKLKYSSGSCNRTIYGNEGRIENFQNFAKNCEINIIADPNKTLSIYFMSFFFYDRSINCSKTGFEIRETNSTGPRLLRTCGIMIPDPIFSNSSKLVLKSYNNDNRYITFHLMYIASDQPQGCGGQLYNLKGKFTSPLYPNPYRKEAECTWKVMVPKGYKVALKFMDFDIGGACNSNNVKVFTGGESTKFCSGVKPAVLYSEGNTLELIYTSSINNGGTGWIVRFQAVKSASDPIYW
ncbi:cubilin-like isoform X2 [Anthonomus grandis grandis]|uniref:cubilin-like isoform X2 n=1 Tax=Anthonomus grandis grandis TaxID=2921223 RepID=UPI0021665CB2|nr:cubilin-like isoform X2 [Anthonomus grandis grandis]